MFYFEVIFDKKIELMKIDIGEKLTGDVAERDADASFGIHAGQDVADESESALVFDSLFD